MRVVVTGGSGRLGRSVVRELVEHGHVVMNADRHPFVGDPSARFMPVDLMEMGQAVGALAAHEAEAVVHLAAFAEPQFYPEEVTFRNNVLTTFHVLQAAATLGVNRVVYAGSPNVNGWGGPGWRPQYLPVDEEHPPAVWHAYNLSKLLGEQIGAMFHRQTAGRLKTISVRPCYVVAPEEWSGRVPAQGGGTVKDRLDDIQRSGPTLFNYVDARDAAQVFRLALEHLDELPGGEIFYAGAPDALAREPLCDLIPRLYPGTEAMAAGLTGTTPAVSIEKARRVLGYQPRYSWRTELAE